MTVAASVARARGPVRSRVGTTAPRVRWRSPPRFGVGTEARLRTLRDRLAKGLLSLRRTPGDFSTRADDGDGRPRRADRGDRDRRRGARGRRPPGGRRAADSSRRSPRRRTCWASGSRRGGGFDVFGGEAAPGARREHARLRGAGPLPRGGPDRRRPARPRGGRRSSTWPGGARSPAAGCKAWPCARWRSWSPRGRLRLLGTPTLTRDPHPQHRGAARRRRPPGLRGPRPGRPDRARRLRARSPTRSWPRSWPTRRRGSATGPTSTPGPYRPGSPPGDRGGTPGSPRSCPCWRRPSRPRAWCPGEAYGYPVSRTACALLILWEGWGLHSRAWDDRVAAGLREASAKAASGPK